MIGAAHDTVSPHLTRLLVRAGATAGVERARLAGIPGLHVLHEDGIRIPTGTILKVWELLSGRLTAAGSIAQVMKLWQPGALGVWEYLLPVSRTLDEAFRTAGTHFNAIADPADRLQVVRSQEGLTVSWQGPYRDHAQYPRIAQFVPHMLLTVAGSAAGRRLVPVRVGLPDSRSLTADRAGELYHTRRIDVGVDHPSITFAEADVDQSLPRSDPALASILADHARLATAAARPVRGWLDRFHAVLESSVAEGPPSLDRIAHHLAISPRTLQRRLREEGTSWREELEELRRRRVACLLRETQLSVEAIASRVGFTDSRSLRRAIHRWYGHGPAMVRAAGGPA